MKKVIAMIIAGSCLVVPTPSVVFAEGRCPITVWEGSRKTTQWVPCRTPPKENLPGYIPPRDEDFGGMPDPRDHPPGEVDPNEWPSENE